MDLVAVRAFVAVARARGFTAAARTLDTTQPNVSRRVQQLERELGARLVVRSGRGVALTRAGERFLSHAERAIAAIESGLAAVDEVEAKPHGTVAVGTMPTVGAYFLPEVLARFLRDHPQVVVRLREGFPSELEELVARGELDLAVLNLPVRRADLAVRRLWQEDYLLVVPQGHRLATSKRVDLAEVAGEPLVVIPGVPATQALVAACDEKGVPAKIALETDNLESIRRMVERGLGVALLPRILAAATGARGVRAIEVARGGLKRQVALVHRGEGYLSAAARVLRTLLVESARAR